MMIRATLAATALLMTASAASADETWDTRFGQMIWETDINDTAVLLLRDDENNTSVRFFVQGLAPDMLGDRGTYVGVWIGAQKAEDVETGCGLAMIDPLGSSSVRWGTFQITFVAPRFPSDWAGVFGQCLEERLETITGIAPQ